MVLAGLLGGGVAAGALTLANWATGPQAGEVEETIDEPGDGVEVNDPDSATVVTAAAAEASPSVVTLAVGAEDGAGSGSGIILDEEGHVLTNTHVVTLGGATAEPEIYARLADGRTSSAQIVGLDPLSDLAVIRLDDAEDLTPAELGSSSDLNVGDRAIAIGSPLGLSGTVTDGIISTLDRTIQVASAAVEDEPGIEQPEEDDGGEGFEFYFPDQEETPQTQGQIYLNVIQTDAAINQGNSGGALVDSEGRVIGVNVAIASTGGMFGEGAGNIGVGFSIPIDYAQRVAQELIEHGEASHGLLGVTATTATPDPELNEEILEAFLNEDPDVPMPEGFPAGALVTQVSDEAPAAEGGIQPGDVITEVEGRHVEDQIALTAIIREYAAGETVTITVQRDGEEYSTEVTLSGM